MASLRDTFRRALRSGVTRAARALGLDVGPVAAATVGGASAPRSEPSAGDVLREPSARVWLDWDADRVQSAEVLAASGDLRLAAELCHALMADERVISNAGVLTRGLLGLPLSFEPGAGRRKGAAVRALEADEDWYAMATEAELAELLQWGVLLGVALAKLTPVVAPSGRTVLKIEPWDPRWLRWDDPSQRWMVTTANRGEIPVEEDGRWLLLTPFGAHRPWERGLWRALARWCLLKKYAREDWARHGETKAQGVLVGLNVNATKPGETDLSPAQRQKLASQLRNLGRDAALVLPRGLDLKLIESAANNFQTYEAQINAANTGITICLLGQNLTTEVSGGSYAAAQVHSQVADYLRRMLAEVLSTTLHDKVLSVWALWNFGSVRVAPWPSWKVDPTGDAKARGEAMVSVSSGIEAAEKTAPPGFVVDREAIYADANIPLKPAPKLPQPPAVNDTQQPQDIAA